MGKYIFVLVMLDKGRCRVGFKELERESVINFFKVILEGIEKEVNTWMSFGSIYYGFWKRVGKIMERERRIEGGFEISSLG